MGNVTRSRIASIQETINPRGKENTIFCICESVFQKLFVILHLPVDPLLYNEDVSKQKNK